jgi:hypothetical protein
MSTEAIKTIGLRSLGILLVMAGAALLIPSMGATEKRTQEAVLHAQLAACLSSDARLDECRRTARRAQPFGQVPHSAD